MVIKVIKLTKLNGSDLYLNPLLIESIELVPDTVITLTNDKKVIVSNSVEYIIEQIVDFYSRFNIFPSDYYGTNKDLDQ
jgi:flagellar protein FlbD